MLRSVLHLERKLGFFFIKGFLNPPRQLSIAQLLERKLDYCGIKHQLSSHLWRAAAGNLVETSSPSDTLPRTPRAPPVGNLAAAPAPNPRVPRRAMPLPDRAATRHRGAAPRQEASTSPVRERDRVGESELTKDFMRAHN